MKNVIKLMLAVTLSLPLVFAPAPSVAEGVKEENGMVRYELWVLADDCSMIESTTRNVNGAEHGKAFIHILPSGDVYFKFEGVGMDKVTRSINVSGKMDFSARTVKTPWGFYTTPATHTGNRFVLDEILNNGRVGVTFESGVGSVWPIHGAMEAWQALNTCNPQARPNAL